jgi:hypothetical protein
MLRSILVSFQSLVSLIWWYRFWFHYLFYELFKDPISLRDKRIKIKSKKNCFYISMSSWLSWVDRIYISFLYFIVLMTLWVDRIYISFLYLIVLMTPWVDHIYISFFYISMSSWLSWVDRIYISFLYFIVLMTSWVDRIYIPFYISLSSWLHELIVFIFPLIFHCPHDFHELIVFTLIVLMIYFNPLSSYLVVLVI